MSFESQLDKKEMLYNLDILKYFDGAALPAPMKLIKNAGGKDLVPLYFVASSNDDLYICTRGATDANDFQIVFDIDNVDFCGGKAHRGILSAARAIVNDNKDLISQTKGNIYVMGHSLGAATSIAVSSILRLEQGMTNVFCYNFAQFPVFSAEVADKTRDWMTSIIYGNDVVPKLTTKNVAELIKIMIPQDVSYEEGIQSVKSMVGGLMTNLVAGQGVTDPEQLAKVGDVLSQKLDYVFNLIKNIDYSTTPTLSGKCFHITQSIDFQTNEATFHVNPYNMETRLDLFGIMMGVQQHYSKFYRQVLHQAYDEKPAPEQGPVEDCDLD